MEGQGIAPEPAPVPSLPEIHETESVNEAFRRLARHKVGAFLLRSKDRPPRPIRGVDLANALLARDAGSRSGDLRLGDVIKPGLGFAAATKAEMDALTSSNPPVFVCSNEPPHENLEWNDGYCSECPYPLETVR